MFTNEAKRNLYLSYPLGPGQSFENITLDKKKTIFFPYEKVETVIVADVVERDSSSKIQYSKSYLDLQNKSNPHNENFLKLNDEVIFFSFSDKDNAQTLNGKVVRLKKSSAMVFYIDGNGSFKIDNVNYANLFKPGKPDSLQNFGFKNGETVSFSLLEPTGQTSTVHGLIMGMNPKYALIQTSRGRKSILLTELKKN